MRRERLNELSRAYWAAPSRGTLQAVIDFARKNPRFVPAGRVLLRALIHEGRVEEAEAALTARLRDAKLRAAPFAFEAFMLAEVQSRGVPEAIDRVFKAGPPRDAKSLMRLLWACHRTGQGARIPRLLRPLILSAEGACDGIAVAQAAVDTGHATTLWPLLRAPDVGLPAPVRAVAKATLHRSSGQRELAAQSLGQGEFEGGSPSDRLAVAFLLDLVQGHAAQEGDQAACAGFALTKTVLDARWVPLSLLRAWLNHVITKAPGEDVETAIHSLSAGGARIDADLYFARLALVLGKPEEAIARLLPAPTSEDRLTALFAAAHAAGMDRFAGPIATQIRATQTGARQDVALSHLALSKGADEEATSRAAAAISMEPSHLPGWEALWRARRWSPAVRLIPELGAEAPEAVRQDPRFRRIQAEAALRLADPKRALRWVTRADGATLEADRGLAVQALLALGHMALAVRLVGAWRPSAPSLRAEHALACARIRLALYDGPGALRQVTRAERFGRRKNDVSILRQSAALMASDPTGFGGPGADAETPEASRRERQRLRSKMLAEIRIDPALATEVNRVARARRATEAAAALVRRSGGLTHPAYAFLGAMRREGRLSQNGVAAGEGWPNAIPKLLLQYWEGTPIPTDVVASVMHTRRLNADLRHILWTRETARDTLAEFSDPDVVRAFRLCRLPAERADLFRLAVLAAFGGIWLDIDNLSCAPLGSLLNQSSTALFVQEPLGTVGNDLIAVVPHHPVIEDALDDVKQAILGGGWESIWLRSGPGALTRALARYLSHRKPVTLPPGMHILAPHEARRAVLQHWQMDYKAGGSGWRDAEAQRRGSTPPVRRA